MFRCRRHRNHVEHRRCDTFVFPNFEEICKQYLWKALLKGSSEVAFSDLQRWWGTDSKTKESVEVDIDNPSLAGMVEKVKHLLKIEEI